jgi:single-stranded DNA-binding protein
MASRKSTATAVPEAVSPAEAPEESRITLLGRLCADPQLRHTKATGKPVTTIRVAVNHEDADATFHSVVVWGRTAEVVCRYLRKGRLARHLWR